jgi:hypothetical protein
MSRYLYFPCFIISSSILLRVCVTVVYGIAVSSGLLGGVPHDWLACCPDVMDGLFGMFMVLTIVLRSDSGR